MRILVTGREGQVAQSLAERATGGWEIIFANRPELDLAISASIEACVARISPDLIINAAAYTAVDKAEDEPELAMRVNGEAPAVLARAACKAEARIIHISTDYVFDGSLDRAYSEEDPVAPIGAYGCSKLAGEEAVRTSGADHVILRTAWVYSPFGNNFVKTMLRLAEGRDTLSVVEDQIGNPTSALDIADALLEITTALTRHNSKTNGTYHFSGMGETSWAGFAQHIFEVSTAHGGPSAQVQGIPTSAWPTKAVRPVNSRLDCSKFARTFGHRAPHWRESVEKVVGRLLD